MRDKYDLPIDAPGGSEQASPNPKVTLEPYLPEGTPVLYSDGLSIVTGNGVWNFSFLQAETPVDPRTRPGTIPSRCLVRIIVSEERMPEFLEVIAATGKRRGLLTESTGEEAEAEETQDV